MKRNAWAPLILSLSALVLGAAELKIDHVTVAGPSLAPMEAVLDKLGIRWEYGGQHANHATEMAIASFPDGSYLELIAFQPRADVHAISKHTWYKYMQDSAGPCAWAVRSTDLNAEANRLRRKGLKVSSPSESGRTRPDGYELKWETAQVGTEGNGTYFPFLIRDFTPREKRAFPSGNANNPDWVGVVRVVLAVQDLDVAIARYRKAYGLSEPHRDQDEASFPGTPVVLRKDLERVRQFGEGICEFGVETSRHKIVVIKSS